MNRVLVAAVFALTAVGLARADLLPPGQKNIPINHTIETDKEHPDWVFFTLGGNGAVKAVKLDPKTPLVIPGSGAVGNGPVPRPGEKRTRPIDFSSPASMVAYFVGCPGWARAAPQNSAGTRSSTDVRRVWLRMGSPP